MANIPSRLANMPQTIKEASLGQVKTQCFTYSVLHNCQSSRPTTSVATLCLCQTCQVIHLCRAHDRPFLKDKTHPSSNLCLQAAILLFHNCLWQTILKVTSGSFSFWFGGHLSSVASDQGWKKNPLSKSDSCAKAQAANKLCSKLQTSFWRIAIAKELWVYDVKSVTFFAAH